MGATAAQSVLGKITPINKNRGHLIDLDDGYGGEITVGDAYATATLPLGVKNGNSGTPTIRGEFGGGGVTDTLRISHADATGGERAYVRLPELIEEFNVIEFAGDHEIVIRANGGGTIIMDDYFTVCCGSSSNITLDGATDLTISSDVTLII